MPPCCKTLPSPARARCSTTKPAGPGPARPPLAAWGATRAWRGHVVAGGAAEARSALDRAGRGGAFPTNHSPPRSRDIRDKLPRLGLGWVEHTLTPLEILGQVIAERFGRSRVLVIGAPELVDVVAEAGHEIVGVPEFRKASVVAVGNDFDLTYERLGA